MKSRVEFLEGSRLRVTMLPDEETGFWSEARRGLLHQIPHNEDDVQGSLLSESLFLDEGFGTLDRETLDVVVLGIEALHGGQRMVGVVTHIPDLAERMPARVEVAKQHGRATLAIV